MKKQYTEPTMVVTEMRESLMLDASLEISTLGDGGGAGAKGFDFDFEDEEEE